MSQIRSYVQARPWVGWLFFFAVLAVGAGTVAEQQMKLTDGTFAMKVVQYNLDGTAAGGGDASEAAQDEQTAELQAIRSATESASTSLDNIETNLSPDAVAGNDALPTGPQGMLMFDDASPTTVSEGQARQWRGSNKGDGYIYLRDAAGNERGANVTANNELLVELGAGSASIGTLGANSGVDIGDVTLTASTNYVGKVRLHDGTNDALVDPCQSETKTTTAFSQTSIANVISADAAKINYICAIVIVASAAEVVSVVEDDTSGCGSLTAALAGSTTAANGMSLAANGGFTLGNGQATVLKGSAANRYLCRNRGRLQPGWRGLVGPGRGGGL